MLIFEQGAVWDEEQDVPMSTKGALQAEVLRRE